jgi:hypothetical protein
VKILLENWNKFLKEEQQKPKLFFLIGPPAVGKSTWIKNNAPKDAVIVNRDEMVETIASKAGLTYDEMYVRAPKELTPPITISKESFSDPTKEKEIENYISLVQQAAQKFNSDSNNSELVKKYGKLIPFDKDAFETVLVKFGVKPEFIVPFEYEKIKKSNEDVTAQLDLTRKQSAKDKKSIIIDMVSMSINERNMHRKFLVAAINNLESPNQANPQDINEHYDQVAIVFAPEEGYTPEIIDQIKRVAVERASEIKAAGGSKTIPPQAYDRMFSTYQPPTSEEGFKMVKNVGVPSLNKLKQNLQKEHRNMKVSKNELKNLIAEELEKVVNEQGFLKESK